MLRRANPSNPFPYIVLTAPQQIAAAIKRQVLEGVLKPGDRLPVSVDPRHIHLFDKATGLPL